MRAAQPRTARTPVRAGHAKQGAGNTSLTCAADLAQRARWTPSARSSPVLLPQGLEQNFPAIVVDFLRKPAFNDPAPRPHAVPPCGRVFKCFPRQVLSSLVDLHHRSTVSGLQLIRSWPLGCWVVMRPSRSMCLLTLVSLVLAATLVDQVIAAPSKNK